MESSLARVPCSAHAHALPAPREFVVLSAGAKKEGVRKLAFGAKALRVVLDCAREFDEALQAAEGERKRGLVCASSSPVAVVASAPARKRRGGVARSEADEAEADSGESADGPDYVVTCAGTLALSLADKDRFVRECCGADQAKYARAMASVLTFRLGASRVSVARRGAVRAMVYLGPAAADPASAECGELLTCTRAQLATLYAAPAAVVPLVRAESPAPCAVYGVCCGVCASRWKC